MAVDIDNVKHVFLTLVLSFESKFKIDQDFIPLYRKKMACRRCFMISHAILAETAICSWTETPKMPYHLPHIAYATIAVTSIIGMDRWSNGNKTIKKIYKHAMYFQSIFVLPLITTSLWLNNDCNLELSLLWAVIPIFPFLYYLSWEELSVEVEENFNELALIPLVSLSFMKENIYGLATAIAYDLAQFCFKHGDAFDIPHIAFGNYCLCFFLYFARKALN